MSLLDPAISILLVEDNETYIQYVEKSLIKDKVSNLLHIARDGLEALNMLHGKNGFEKIVPTPKIVLLDINMPRMNGLEFLKNIRNDPELKSLLVFMLTSSDSDRDKTAAYNLNVAGYILKPTEYEPFLHMISTLNLYWNLLEFPASNS